MFINKQRKLIFNHVKDQVYAAGVAAAGTTTMFQAADERELSLIKFKLLIQLIEVLFMG